jgi:DNA helicase-2/ATP-dependent DNA helicase PcrA
MLQILSLPYNNVFVVGDDDQMIYGFRGAEVRHIIDFRGRFPIVNDCVLSTNYRSSKKVVRHSRWLIDHNHDRVSKDIHARAGAQEGVLDILPGENILDQARKAAEWILRQKTDQKQAWKDFAVLYRYNAFEVPVAIALDACKILHTPVNGQRLYQTQVGRDIYAYLSLILYPKDAHPEDFARVLGRPNKYFTNKIIATARNWTAFKQLPEIPDLRNWEQEKLADFVARIEVLNIRAAGGSLLPVDLISILANEFGLSAFYKDQSRMSIELDDASDEMLLDILLAVARSYTDLTSFFQAIYQALNNEAGEEKKADMEPSDEVALSTIHRSKGKEFASVVLFNQSENGKRNGDKSDQEEERRVAYVGATRAKDNLLVTFMKGKPSDFLLELALNPAFTALRNPALLAQKSIAETKRSKAAHNLQMDRQQKEKLFGQFPELSGEGGQGTWSPDLLARVRIWWREYRLRGAVQKLQEIETRMQELTVNEFDPMDETIHTIQSEIEFRACLGKS